MAIVVSCFVILFGTTASATSAYDDIYHDTDTITLENTPWPSAYGACSAVDYTSSWANAMTAALNDNSRNTNNSLAAAYLDSWEVAKKSGRWFVSQEDFAYNRATSDLTVRTYKSIVITWTEDTSLGLDWTSQLDGVTHTGSAVHNVVLRTQNAQTASGGCGAFAIIGGGGYVSSSNDIYGNSRYANLFAYVDNVNYPTGYEGELVSPPNLLLDDDEDGLAVGYEDAQGTSDTNQDTDGDGIDDFKESVWYPDRDDVFCGTSCAYPNPTQKDLYVEIDWMKDGNRTMKPNSPQLNAVTSAFAAKGITVYFDTGQYGGGNELPTYTQDLSFYRTDNATDFYDYKYGNSSIATNFSSDRYRIWHYLLSGYRYSQAMNSSGASYVGDDDSFISTGLIEDTQSGDIDDAMAGTILHELGHSLCLSDAQDYAGQPVDCVYSGVHAENSPTYTTYESVMNYDYQFSDLVDLSDGSNIPEDHDDWGAVAIGMRDFIDSEAEGEDPDALRPDARSVQNVRRIAE